MPAKLWARMSDKSAPLKVKQLLKQMGDYLFGPHYQLHRASFSAVASDDCLKALEAARL